MYAIVGTIGVGQAGDNYISYQKVVAFSPFDYRILRLDMLHLKTTVNG